ncbi:maleylacetate reductase (plasmid) [Agrobacterium fabrum]|uniref:maleylacetate reductase n=1 Tax=Agrobacterium fabrum TaxID=1176649 RepID=UPI0021D2D4E5|nr:maleylacetate reductase [Agrobacterium fabrum]UXT61260.1 maleylacetate reductase [Agrobacterium fabrum]
MTLSFTYTSSPARILFGCGSRTRLAEEIGRLGKSRALVLATPFQKADAEALALTLGPLAAGVFAGATMHTPVDVTLQAMEAYQAQNADCVVSLGGGSTIGLGKAIARRTGADQIVIATTYAGSEVTNIVGETENGIKTTVRGPEILPETVIYDAELTCGLPVAMSVTSGLNAMAHAVEALYAADRNPITSMMALEGISALHKALPVIVSSPGDLTARGQALYGSWLCGSVLGMVSMALHHKLCHTIGGSFDMPHAETHAVLLPHTTAYTERGAADLLKPVADIFSAPSAGIGLYDFAASLGAPLSLAGLGFAESDIGRAAELATQNPYFNPQPITLDGIRTLIHTAWEGTRPA